MLPVEKKAIVGRDGPHALRAVVPVAGPPRGDEAGTARPVQRAPDGFTKIHGAAGRGEPRERYLVRF